MQSNFILLALLTLFITRLDGQVLVGKVINEQGELLIGATVAWEFTSIGTATDADGFFKIPKSDTAGNLVINYVGYNPVLIPMEPQEDSVTIEISGIAVLNTVEVVAQQRGNFTSTLSNRNIESITSSELRKAPCCNLSESFETNASVEVAYKDGVTGAKEIELLGLRGTYTQLLVEKRPVYYGLAMPFALEYIPGTWINSIQIAKGISSLQTGSAGIAGQINTELKKPCDDVPLFLNLFATTVGRVEGNLHLNKKFNEDVSTGLFLHGNIRDTEPDHDGDGFMNMPKKKSLNGLYRLMFRGDVLNAQFNIHGITEERRSGQVIPDGANALDFYQIGHNVDRVDVFGKIGFFGFKESYNSIGLILNSTYHQLNSFYGRRIHNGTQRSLYANLMYNTIVKNTDHKLTLGASFQYDDFDERLDDVDFGREEQLPGIFGEYTYQIQNFGSRDWWHSFALIAGMRVDYHNQFGWMPAPQLSAKLNFNENSVVRISGGRGLRSASVLAENISYLASSRKINLLESLDLEDAWNYGLNYTQNFEWLGKEGSISVDFYRTDFLNQIILDLEANAQEVLIYNLDGISFSNSFLITTAYNPVKGLELKAAYKFNDVQATYRGELLQRPQVARHRGLLTADYETPNKKWRFNASTQLVGPQRMPDDSIIPENIWLDRRAFSPAYAIVNAQATWQLSDGLEIYAGGENLTNYYQHHPIVGYEDPFGGYFDATRIYAPTMGIRGYTGFRWSLK